MPDITAFGSTVELRRNASGNCAAKRGPSFPNETEGRTRGSGNEASGSYDRTKRQARACVGYTLAVYAKARQLRTVKAGRVFANARTRGMPSGAGLDLMGK